MLRTTRILLAVAIFASANLSAAKAETTYDYVGQPFDTSLNATSLFGPNLLGSVTFGFDVTLATSGTFVLSGGQISSLELHSGHLALNASNLDSNSFLQLTNGAITMWDIEVANPNTAGGFGLQSVNAIPGACLLSRTSCVFDRVFLTAATSFASVTGNPGTWSVVGVPFPDIGSGVTGFLLLLFSGPFLWASRISRKPRGFGEIRDSSPGYRKLDL